MATATQWWRTTEQGIACDLCPRACHLHPGQRGFCFVRQNVAGEMVLTTYGLSTGFCIDPIEKKPLNHFLPGTAVLSFGTAGCNLGCKFCQNWSISKAKEVERASAVASPEAIARTAKEYGCHSVAFTYNDPVIWAEYAIDTAQACHDIGIKTVAVTAGYIQPEARPDFFGVMDAANVDLKAFTETFYKYLTYSHLEPVLDTLRWLKHESNVWFEITNLLIPRENDSREEIARMCDWLVNNVGVDVPVHFTAFHPDFRLRDRPPTPPETLAKARELALAAGIRYPYVGNVHDVLRQSTYCPRCGNLLIERDWYELGTYQLRGNRCGFCGTEIAGVFDFKPGRWGRKRLPVQVLPDAEPRAGASTTRISPLANVAPTTCCAPATPVFVNAPMPSSKARETIAESKTKLEISAPIQSKKTFTIEASQDSCTESPIISSPCMDSVGTIPSAPSISGTELTKAARTIVEAALLGQNAPTLPAAWNQQIAAGVFVTLKRGPWLRACRGRWGKPGPMGEQLLAAARDAAVGDPRFPSLTMEELPLIELEVSELYQPRLLEARGEARLHDIEVGRHGMVISHPGGHGLLLPQVASNAKWDKKTFYEHLCRKANLPLDTWKDDAARITTFEARIEHQPPPRQEFNPNRLGEQDREDLCHLANDILQGKDPLAPATDSALTTIYPHALGIGLYTARGQTAFTTGVRQSLEQLTRSAARELLASATDARPPGAIVRLQLFWCPLLLRSEDPPERRATLRWAAILVRRGEQSALVLGENSELDPVAHALGRLGLTLFDWQYTANVEVTAFSTFNHQARTVVDNKSHPPTHDRPMARAGQFYPAHPHEVAGAIDRFLAIGRQASLPQPQRYQAIMLPHAGWNYCGSVIGKTLARVVVPDLVILIGPKHTPHGDNWAVSPARHWRIPGGSVPVASEPRASLLGAVPNLVADASAHEWEHGLEVLVPFLHHLNPSLQILPIVMGRSSYSATAEMARGLHQLLTNRFDMVLLVISSDLNHFATETENRRRDLLALNALATGDPSRLHAVVREHDISMCGVLPAVTVLQTLIMLGQTPPVQVVDYTNSGLVTGDHQRVVGYAGAVINPL